MPQAQTMTLDEKLSIGCNAAELWDAGDKEGVYNPKKSYILPLFPGRSSTWIRVIIIPLVGLLFFNYNITLP